MNTEKLELWYPTEKFAVTQFFGEKNEMYTKLGLLGHNGIDLVALDSQIVRAAHDGVIVYAGLDSSAGQTVVIRTLNKKQYGTGSSYYKTIYGHLKNGGIKVHPGQEVKAGDIIALADNTGLSTGSHLHFALKPVYAGEQEWQWANAEQSNGYLGAIDPLPFFNGFHARDAATVTSKLQTILSLLRQALFTLAK